MNNLEIAGKLAAIEAAISHFAEREQYYRNLKPGKPRRLSEKIRQEQVVQYAQYQENMRAIILSLTGIE